MNEASSKDRSIFYAALAVNDSEQRRNLLDSLCAGDPNLRRQVEELLVAHEDNSVLKNLAPDAAGFGGNVEDVCVGQMVGRFKLREKIGEGGFGLVYMADQLEPIQRRVALKVIKAGMDTKQVIARFEAERQALAMMEHPNIAKVIDAGATDTGRPYFVMELVRGISITQFCDTNLLTTEERLQIFMDVCSAIQHAHQKGVIHRDIKPNNILVADDGERHVAKVIDFGIAKATQGRLTDKTLFTQFRQLVGTPAYMSPEQAQMTAVDVDTRSDVFSLGVLLYELLTGKTPFDSTELADAGFEEMCRRIREVEPAAPSTRLSSLSVDERTTAARLRRIQQVELEQMVRGELDWIVMKAIEKSRARRYESAGALKQDVQRFLANEPISAAAPSTAYLASKFLRRNKRLMLVALTICGLLLVGSVLSTLLAVRAGVAEDAAVHNLALAKKNELALRHNQYAIEMLLAQSSASGVNSENVYELLKKQIPEPGEPDFRGFEWRRLWNNTHRRQLFALEGHTDETRSVAMSPDGRWLASGSTDGTARIWDIAKRRQIWSVSKGEDCNHVAFSPDGRSLVTRFWNPRPSDQRWILWDVTDPSNPTELRDLKQFTVFSPDKKTAIGFISRDAPPRSTLRRFDLESGETVHEFSDPAFDDTPMAGRVHKSGVWTTTVSQDGTRLLTVGQDKTVKLWNTIDGSLTFRIESDTEVFDAAFSPTDETFATVSIDTGLLQLWSCQPDAEGEARSLHQMALDIPVDRVRFTNDGKKLIASERFGRIHVFDTRTWDELAAFDSRGSIKALRVCSPVDPDIIVTASEISQTNSIRFWDVSTKEVVLDHEFPVRSLEFSGDGTMLAVGLANGAVQFWDMAKRTTVFTTTATRSINPEMRERPALTTYGPGFVQISPDDRNAAIVGPRGKVTIWDLKTREPVASLKIPEQGAAVFSPAFSPTGDQLFMATRGKIYVWNFRQPGQPTTTFEQGGKARAVLAWGPSGNLLASGGMDVRLWHPAQLEPFRVLDMSTLPPDSRGPLCLAFSPSGKWLAGGTSVGKVWLWDTDTWSQQTLPLVTYVMNVGFSPDSQRLVAGDMWSVVKMWDTELRQTVATFNGSIAEFSPDGEYLAVGCEAHLSSVDMPESGRVRLYYAPSLEVLDAESTR